MPGSLALLDLPVNIPYHFRCPISLELMSDPVTICTGMTYDRSSIDSWIATGNISCPVTRTQLTDFSIIPNHTLRRLIQEWCVANRGFGVERIPTPKQPADPTMVRSLLSQASSDFVTYKSRLSALRRLRGLACDSEKNRVVISSCNSRAILLQIVFSDPDCELNHVALAVLVQLHLDESECVSVSTNSDRVGYLTRNLFHPSVEIRVNSAALIEMVISGTSSPELRSEMSNSDAILQGVIDILMNPIPHPRGLKAGIKTLLALSLIKQNRSKAISAGSPAILIDLLPDLDKCDAERALATIELLCRVPEGCAAFSAHSLTVTFLAKIVLKISDRATEYAAGALLSLCSVSELSRQEAVAAGVLRQLLLVLQSDCTDRAKRKAQMLLKLLRSLWPQDSDVNTDIFYDVVYL